MIGLAGNGSALDSPRYIYWHRSKPAAFGRGLAQLRS
jgi:hypothetical protein